MELSTFIEDAGRKARLALLTGKSEGYLWQVATGWRGKKASAELAIAIEAATGDIGPEVVPRHLIRPDLWAQPSEGESGAHRTPAATDRGAAAEADADQVQPLSKVA